MGGIHGLLVSEASIASTWAVKVREPSDSDERGIRALQKTIAHIQAVLIEQGYQEEKAREAAKRIALKCALACAFKLP